MTLQDDFRELAVRLVEADARRPRAINLRRAVSASYYAVFHRLISDATGMMFGRGAPVPTTNPHNPRVMRPDHEVARWFNHGQMREISDWFARPSTAREPIKGLLMAGQDAFVPSDLQTLANYLVDLQKARHAADYDRSLQLNRTDARRIVDKAARAFELCDQLASDAMYRLYLLLLLGGERIARPRT